MNSESGKALWKMETYNVLDLMDMVLGKMGHVAGELLFDSFHVPCVFATKIGQQKTANEKRAK